MSRLLSFAVPAWWIRTACCLGALAVLMLYASPASHAQEPPLPPEPEAEPAASDSLEQARQYLRTNDPESAVDLLEALVNAHPDRSTYQYELVDAYEELKEYEAALDLMRDLTRDDPSASDLADKGRLYALAGNDDAAQATWDAAIDLAPESSHTYRSVYHTLSEMRRFSDAVEIMEQGREAMNDPDAFRTELAYLYSLSGQEAQAMREYVALLDEQDQRLNFVKSRMQPFLRQAGDVGDAIEVLEDAVEERPEHGVYLELLAWLYAEQEDYSQALSAYEKLDDHRDDDGTTLLDFARQAANADAFDTARDAFSYIRTHYPDTEAALHARILEANLAYRRWTQAEPFTDAKTQYANEAWERYQDIADDLTNDASLSDDEAQFWKRMGTLALDHAQSLSEARRAAETLKRTNAYRGQGHLLNGRIALRGQDVDAARDHFESAQNDATSTAHYYLGLLAAYDNELEAARTHLETLLEDLSRDAANESIALHAALRHFASPKPTDPEASNSESTDTALHHYIAALLYKEQHRWSAADDAYAAIGESAPGHPLTERAQYHRARLQLHLNEATDASEALVTFADSHPQHAWADRALFEAASLLHHAAEAPSEARTLYMRLLDQHPRSVFAADARERVRDLPSS